MNESQIRELYMLYNNKQDLSRRISNLSDAKNIKASGAIYHKSVHQFDLTEISGQIIELAIAHQIKELKRIDMRITMLGGEL